MKIAITGASGFIGRETVIEALRRGHDVVAVTRTANFSLETRSSQLEIRVCDLSDESSVSLALNDCDCVIHLAADMKSNNPLSNTINLTENVLEAMRCASIHRLILCSSISVLNYVNQTAMDVIDESTARCENESLMGQYAAMKCEQERLVESWQVGNNLLTIIRPGLVYDENNLSDAHAGIFKSGIGIAALHPGQIPLVRNDSVAEALVAASDRMNPQGLSIYHLVDSQLPSQRAYLKALRSTKVIQAYLPIPWKLYGLGAQVFRFLLGSLGFRSRLPDAFYANSVAARCKPFLFDNRVSCDALGWAPRQTQL